MKNKIVMNLQLFAGSKSGVYPCYENQFQIDTAASGGTASLKNIAVKPFPYRLTMEWKSGTHMIQKDGPDV